MENLRVIREKRGYNQLKVAMHIGVTQANISHYENGTFEPSLDSLIKIAKYLNTSVDYLLGLTPDDCPALQRNKSDLTAEEIELLEAFNNISEEERNTLLKWFRFLKMEKEEKENLTKIG